MQKPRSFLKLTVKTRVIKFHISFRRAHLHVSTQFKIVSLKKIDQKH